MTHSFPKLRANKVETLAMGLACAEDALQAFRLALIAAIVYTSDKIDPPHPAPESAPGTCADDQSPANCCETPSRNHDPYGGKFKKPRTNDATARTATDDNEGPLPARFLRRAPNGDDPGARSPRP